MRGCLPLRIGRGRVRGDFYEVTLLYNKQCCDLYYMHNIQDVK